MREKEYWRERILIGEAALAVNLKLRPSDIFGTIHPHPTFPESFVEALRDIYGESIQLPIKSQSKAKSHIH